MVKQLTARAVPFVCRCGERVDVVLEAGVATPSLVDCGKCGERDCMTPATSTSSSSSSRSRSRRRKS